MKFLNLPQIAAIVGFKLAFEMDLGHDRALWSTNVIDSMLDQVVLESCHCKHLKCLDSCLSQFLLEFVENQPKSLVSFCLLLHHPFTHLGFTCSQSLLQLD